MPDPKKKSTSKNKGARPYTATTKSGSKISVKKKSVSDAKAKKGVFKERPSYKGKTISNKSGKMSGYTKHDGSYTRTSTTGQRKSASKAISKDKRAHKKDSISHSSRIKTFSTAKRKK